ncbi:MAG: FtsB family cell division protein [Lentisphaeria bacterium]
MRAILLAIVFIICGYVCWDFYGRFTKSANEYNAIRIETELMQQRCRQAEKMIADLKVSPAAVERVAREKFGWCREDEQIYRFDTPQ